MASTYDIETVSSMQLTHEDAIQIAAAGVNPGYVGIHLLPVPMESRGYGIGHYLAIGPRESLLTLKYDLEKKRYEP